MYIYKTICVVNNKIYIGQCAKQPHLSQNYLGSGNLILQAIKKHGKHNFTKQILKENISTQRLLDIWEQIFIKKFDAVNKGYNLSKGGQFNNGYKHSEEVKILISKSCAGRQLTKEHRNKIGIGNKGKILSQEQKDKI